MPHLPFEPDCRRGDRIRLRRMGADPCPIPGGATGVVRGHFYWSDGTVQVNVAWDIHRSLALIWPIDQFHVIERPRAAYFREQLA